MNTKNCMLALLLALTFFASTAQATLITVNDGDQFNYDAANSYYFDAAMSAADPTVTFGANVDPGESFIFTVTAPAEFDLYARLTTAPDGSGSAIVGGPNSMSTVYAGTSFDFVIDGNYFIGQTNWMSLSIGGIQAALDYAATLPGGLLPVGAVASSPDPNLSFLGGDTGGSGGDNGDGGSSGNVPNAPTWLLLIGGFALLIEHRRRMKGGLI